MSVLFAIAPTRERLEHFLQICRQRCGEFHTSSISRMREREPLRMEEWPLQAGNGADVAGDPPVNAAVQRITDDRMTDCAEMHTYLVCAAGMNGHLAQRQSRQVERLRNSCDRFTCPAGSCGHLLPVYGIPSDRGIDASARLHDTPDKRDVLLLHFAIVKLPREFLMCRVAFRHDHD